MNIYSRNDAPVNKTVLMTVSFRDKGPDLYYLPYMWSGIIAIIVLSVIVAVMVMRDLAKKRKEARKKARLREMLKKNPTDVIRKAVRRMMPKTSLGRRMMKKLKIYAGPSHPHEAQKPVPLDIVEFMG